MKVIRVKRIIVDSIKDHVIPIVSSKKTCIMLYPEGKSVFKKKQG